MLECPRRPSTRTRRPSGWVNGRATARTFSPFGTTSSSKWLTPCETISTVSSLLSERIARRYGPNTGLAAVDVIVQVCAAFWDFCEEHPDYASLLPTRSRRG